MDVGIETSSPPCARSLHAAATWKDQMFIFGGYDGQSRRNDFYSFHFKNQQWKLLNEDTHDIRGTPPSPRDRHCAVVYNDAFYVFGGFDGSARVNDFHKYDILEQEWTRILPNVSDMTLPTSRHSHSAVVHNNSMWVFGGYDGSYRCDLYEYNFLTNVWTVVDTVGRIPRPRYRATCVIYNNCLILHGGHDGTRHLEDTHVLDLELKRWTSLVRIGNPPSSRDSHVSFIYNNAMYVVGGSAGGTAMNDMHELFMESSEDGLIPVW
jgi:N-acetylneuraminic acid mutarotase